MHETVFAKRIIDEASKHGIVTSIKLEIGELAHVPAAELVDCLKTLVDWKIQSKTIPANVKCTCGFIGHPKILERGHDFFFIECPKCGEIPELIDGTDIKIVSIRVK